MPFDGLYRAQVVNTTDPLSQGRVRLACPQLWGDSYSDWVKPVFFSNPAVGDQVWMGFEAGDLDHPVWIGPPQVLQAQIWSAVGTAPGSGSSTIWDNQTQFGTFSFTKRMAGTKLTFLGTTSAYASAVGVDYSFGLFFNGADHLLGSNYFSASADHRTLGLAASVSDVPAGTYVLQPRYFLNAGSISVDTYDSLCLEIKETW